IYEDGWSGDQGFMTLYAESAGVAVMRGLLPAGIGLDSVDVTLTVGSAPPVRRKLKQGPFEIAVPVEAGRVRIGFRFSSIGRLPAGDGRPAVARLALVAIDTNPDRAAALSNLSDAAPPEGSGLAKLLGAAAEDATGVFSDGWI